MNEWMKNISVLTLQGAPAKDWPSWFGLDGLWLGSHLVHWLNSALADFVQFLKSLLFLSYLSVDWVREGWACPPALGRAKCTVLSTLHGLSTCAASVSALGWADDRRDPRRARRMSARAHSHSMFEWGRAEHKWRLGIHLGFDSISIFNDRNDWGVFLWDRVLGTL